jgi:hypothetical protein
MNMNNSMNIVQLSKSVPGRSLGNRRSCFLENTGKSKRNSGQFPLKNDIIYTAGQVYNGHGYGTGWESVLKGQVRIIWSTWFLPCVR